MPLKLLLIVSSVFLVACSSAAKKPIPEPVTIVKHVAPDCGSPPPRDQVRLRPTPSWQVSEGRFSVSAKGYEDLSYNMAEIEKGVLQLRLELDYYKLCLEDVGQDTDNG